MLCFYFSFNPKKLLIYHLISVLSQFPVSNELFSFRELEYFCWYSALIHSGLVRIKMLFQISSVYWDLSCVQIYVQFGGEFHGLLKRKWFFFLLFRWNYLQMLGSFIVLFHSRVYLVFAWITCLWERVGYQSHSLSLCYAWCNCFPFVKSGNGMLDE